jgi:hypothetical protein
MEHRIIRIGHHTMIGVVCPHCLQRMTIYPEAALIAHLRTHHQARLVYHRKAGNTRGRPPGQPHEIRMGSALVFHEGIKAR